MARNVDLEIDIVKAATDRAILVVLTESGREVWIPRFVITDDSAVTPDASENDTGILTIQEWFAENEGLTEDEDS
jgi:hypothetical protein